MMNIIELQDNLKNFSEDQLVNEMQTPSGMIPQFLVLSELMEMIIMAHIKKLHQYNFKQT